MSFTNIASQEYESGSTTVGSSNPISRSFTIPSLATNSIGVVMLGWQAHGANTGVISSATWGGTTMTKTAPSGNSLTNVPMAHMWHLFNPPNNASRTIAINFSAPSIAITVTYHLVIVYADAQGVVKLDDTSEGSGSTSAASITSTQAYVNELVLSLSAHTANAVSSPSTTNCTELQNYDSGGNCSIAAYTTPSGTGDATHQHNYSQTGTYAIVSASFTDYIRATLSKTLSLPSISASGKVLVTGRLEVT